MRHDPRLLVGAIIASITMDIDFISFIVKGVQNTFVLLLFWNEGGQTVWTLQRRL